MCFQDSAHPLSNLHFNRPPDFICHVKTDVETLFAVKSFLRGVQWWLSHLWSVAGINELYSVHLNKQKETSAFSCLVITFFRHCQR